jgi:hypothetical protein
MASGAGLGAALGLLLGTMLVADLAVWIAIGAVAGLTAESAGRGDPAAWDPQILQPGDQSGVDAHSFAASEPSEPREWLMRSFACATRTC